MIPKVINYCWFGNKKKPREVRKCIESWQRICPDYEIIEWNESNFNVSNNKFALSAYQNKAWAFVSDYVRLKVIYDNGGIYLDTDIELLKSLDPLLNNKFYIGVQQIDGKCNTGLGFGAERKNNIVKLMLEAYEKIIFKENNKDKLTCPILNDKVIRKIGYKNTDKVVKIKGATIYPSRFFDPISAGNTRNLLSSDSFSMTHNFASWMSPKTRLKRKLISYIGWNTVNKIKAIRNCLKLK